jgi:hypothetical protein
MAHHHHEDDTYFLDQLCMVALSGAFGVICLALYFLQQGMLFRLLGQQFHPFVLGSGIVLVVIAGLRAGLLWQQAGQRQGADADQQGHAHDECCAHSDGDNGHAHAHSHAEHAHSHAHGDHDHGDDHAHAVGHAHSHSHSHGDGADHEHAWAPWRYVVLLIPIMLFLLGLPSKGPALNANLGKIEVDFTEEAMQAATFVSVGPSGWAQIVAVRASADQVDKEAIPVDFKRLEIMSSSASDRDYWNGKTIKVKGQFMPQSDRVFHLVRLRIQCCAADAVQLNVPIIAKDSITDIQPESWVVVTGRVAFREVDGKTTTSILVQSRRAVEKTSPDINPYEQF